MTGRLGLAWRLARRELRSSFTGFTVFLACLALGVAAIAAVGVINAGVIASLSEDSASLLGGDIKIESTNQPIDEAELRDLVPAGARRSDAVRTNTMAMGNDGRRVVVSLKAVDRSYPLIGDVRLDPPARSMTDALAEGGAVVERGLLARLGLDLGDPIRIGGAAFTLRAVVEREPDRIGGFVSIGPRVFISLDDLPATGIIQPGSLVHFDYRFLTPPGFDVDAHLDALQKAHPDARWRASGVRDIQPRVTEVTDRLASYLTIAGLTSLLIGGVGVSLAIQNYLAGKTGTIATLKCLGASSRLIFWVYLLQVVALASGGIVLGLVLGQAIPWLVRALTEGLLPVQIRTGFYPLPLIVAAGCGLLTALTFAIWPLALAGSVSPAGMFRALLAPPRRWPSLRILMLLATCVLGLGGLAVLGVTDRFLAMVFIAVALAAALLLFSVAKIALYATKMLAGRGGARWRMALANLHRPGAHATSVVVALGAGLTVLTLVAVLNRNLNAELDRSFAERMPSVFFIDIQPAQRDRFVQTVADVEDAELLQVMPIIRGRVVRIKDVPVEQTGITHWTLRHDRALSYAATPPPGAGVVAGDWWPPDYLGPPLLAIETEVAQAYDVKVGDRLGFNVLGRVIEAEIAAIRPEIDWSQGRLDAVFLFSPGVLEAAPHSFAAAVELPEPAEAALLDRMAVALPNVTPISMREVGSRMRDILGRIRLAILAVAGVTMASGVLVLAGAVAAARRRHLYESAVLKVLGARRLDLLGLFAIEYLSLGSVSALVGGALGLIAAYAVVTWVMAISWVWAPWAMAGILFTALVLTFGAGFVGTWRLLGRSAGSVLRVA